VVVVVLVVGGRCCGTSWVFISGCLIVCPDAKDATAAKPMVKSILFMLFLRDYCGDSRLVCLPGLSKPKRAACH
jgi:hypothetical protein